MNNSDYDPIADVQRIKDEIAAEYNYDLDAMFQATLERQRSSGRVYHELHPDGSRTLHQYGKPIAEVPAGVDYRDVLASLGVTK